MTERSAPWNGTVTGDATAAPYDAPTEFAEWIRTATGVEVLTDKGGVAYSELNELATTGVASPVTIDTGRAIVHGTRYEADAAVLLAIPTPAVSTRIDRIVLRKDWVAQTIRITRVAGVEGGGVPALTQVAGVTWDNRLYQASITTLGIITLTDEREFIPLPAFKDSEGNPSNVISGASADGTSNYPEKRGHTHHLGILDGVQVFLVASYTAASGGSIDEIEWDNEDFDDNAMHTGGANGDRLVATVAGKYLITVNLEVQALVGGLDAIFYLTHGTGPTDLVVFTMDSMILNELRIVSFSHIRRMLAGEWVQLRVDSTANSVQIIGGATKSRMAMQFLGD